MQPAIIGTAGPAGHGKTALVRALAETPGAAPDAERDPELGAALELGFGFHDIVGHRVGVVDLPGNERLVRGLLGDVHGIDLVLLVVAADDGVKPQTEECVDLLHLLGAKWVLLVVTKIDLVDAARVATVRDEIVALVQGTSFASAPVHTVSSTRGDGVAALRAEIVRRMGNLPARGGDGWFRMFVDRSFFVPGRGLTVTGTALAGTLRAGDALALRPGVRTAEARTIQVHGETVTTAVAGQRIAVQLAKFEPKQVRRGVVLADPRIEFATDRFDCWLEVRPSARAPLRSFDRLEIDIGTVETAGTVVVLGDGDELAPRSSGFCQIALERDVVVTNGDRFVLRPEGGTRTSGGGVVLHPFAVRHRSGEDRLTERLARLREQALAPRVLAFLELLPEFAVPLGYLAQGLGRTVDEVRRAAGGIPDLVALPATGDPEAYTVRDKWVQLVAAVVEALTRFHRTHPLEPGMDPEALRSRLRVPIPPRLLAAVVERLVAEKVIAREDALVRLPKHRAGQSGPSAGPSAQPRGAVPAPKPAAPSDVASSVREALADGGFTPPDLRNLEGKLQIPSARLAQILETLEREGTVVRVGADLAYDRGAFERAQALLVDFLRSHPEITVADYRTLLEASRRYALALLDHFDRAGLTVRIADARRLRESPGE